MLPYYIGGYIPNVTDAFFETMSGFSSTGATIMNNIESMPHGILFWRAMTQWIGGLGIVFFTIAVLPIFGMGGIQVFAAEASGPTHDKVHPRIGVTAKWIWGIYAGMTGTLIVLLVFGGMGLFDSICHAFTTTSTGGFSTKQTSIEYYHSPYIDYVISIFMFLSGVNFTLLLLMFNGKIKKFIHDAELKFYFISVAFSQFSLLSGFIRPVRWEQKRHSESLCFKLYHCRLPPVLLLLTICSGLLFFGAVFLSL